MKQKNIYFSILVIFTFFTLSFLLAQKVFQNDTFYTIKVGESIMKNGIDMKDHFSFITNLSYTYPHWLYDVLIYLQYSVGGFTLIYISTMFIGFCLLNLLYFFSKKLTNNKYISYILIMLFSFCLGGYITPRAQSISYIFLLTILYSIEMLRKTNKKRYLIYLFLSSLLIANMHLAVWPFIFALFLPFIVQDIIYLLNKKYNWKLEKKFNIEIEKSNLKITFVGLFICFITGFMTPNFLVPFTYYLDTKKGISLKIISEHLPNTITHSPEIFVLLLITILLLLNKNITIKLRDFFLLCGLFLLSFLAIRNESLLLILSLFTYARLFNMLDFSNLEKALWQNLFITLVILIFVVVFILTFFLYSKRKYVDEKEFPVEASEYIINNLDYKNIRLFNQYNFGSYLMYKGIPVFIDSRADLYLEEFNSECTVFKDYSKLDDDYQIIFEKYDFTHAILKNDSFLNVQIRRDSNFKQLYNDNTFTIYEVGAV